MKKYGIVVVTTLLPGISVGFWAMANGRLMPEIVHTADDIATAHRMFAWTFPLSAALFMVGLAITAVMWRRERGVLFRVVSAIPVVALAVSIFLARGTVVELMMFSPVKEARFVRAADAGFLESGHLVMGVSIDGSAKAYPVGMLAYHHIVNDQLAGEPYVATY